MSEEQLALSAEPVEPVEAPVEPVEKEPEKKEDPTGLRDTIRAAVQKASEPEEEQKEAPKDGRVRGPDGKFLPKEQKLEAKETPQETKAPVEKPQEGAEPETPKGVPGTWKAEAKAKWEGLDPLVKSEVLRRESESTREIAKYRDELTQYQQAYAPIEQLIGPRRALWRTQFGSEAQAMSQLLNISDLASQDPNAFLRYYISQADISPKLDLEKVFGHPVDTGDDISSNPVVQQLRQSLDGLNQQVSGFLNQQQTQELSSVESQIEAFAAEKDESGNLKRPHFEAVREAISNSIPAIRAQMPNATVPQVMEAAYNAAIYANSDIASQLRAAQETAIREKIEKEQRAHKAQLASKSLDTGSPPSGGGNSPSTDLRATLVENLKRFKQGQDARV